jgi:hypothetical protein
VTKLLADFQLNEVLVLYSWPHEYREGRKRMSVVVKVKVCADCFHATTSERDSSQLVSQITQEISDGFRLWEDYQFAPTECSYVDFLNDTLCGICRRSLTKDRRQVLDENIALERRELPDADRRTPFGRGSRVLLASLRAA